MHFNLKRITSLLVASAIAIPVLSGNTVYNAINPVAAENNGFSSEEIMDSAVKPTLSVSCIELSYEEAILNPVQELSISVSGADAKYSVTGIHVYWDEKLTPITNDNGFYAQGGEAIDLLLKSYYNLENGFFAATSYFSDIGRDGEMYTFKLELPKDIKGGEIFDVSIVYEENDICGDLFTNALDDENGKLMQAWTFTKGIKNGYIRIAAPATSTTSTSTTASTTTTTSTPTTTTTSTTTSKTTTSTTTSNTTTSTTTSKTTTSTTTPKTTTSTTTSKTTTSTTTSKTTTSTTTPKTTTSTTTSNTTTSTTTSKTTTSTTSKTTTSTTTTLPPVVETILYGDVDFDNKIAASDASLTLVEYADRASGKSSFSDKQFKACDVNEDGKIGADDAANILEFYSYLAGNGTEKDMKKWFESLR
ncbi:MAG: dockerin type I domain-containing protein [Ruminococcus sp.]|nr:dockerin type I domain-containing protein [Ruminococcus sp.]